MLVGHVLEAVLNGDLSALIPPALSSIIDGAKDALKEKLNELNPAKEFMNDLKNWAKNQFEDWMPDASELERIEKDINDSPEGRRDLGEECRFRHRKHGAERAGLGADSGANRWRPGADP